MRVRYQLVIIEVGRFLHLADHHEHPVQDFAKFAYAFDELKQILCSAMGEL